MGRGLKLPALIFLLTAISLALASAGSADRMFSEERGISVPRVENAAAYEWERDPPSVSTTITAAPSLRVFEPWIKAYRWRVRALPASGSSLSPSEWSDWSERASWWRDVNTDGNSIVLARDVAACASLFGYTLTNGEWLPAP